MQNDQGCFGIPKRQNPPRSEVFVSNGNGHGTTNTKIRRFSTIRSILGDAITYVDDAALGASFIINQDGIYGITYTDRATANSADLGASVNSTELTTNIQSVLAINVLCSVTSVSSNYGCAAGTFFLKARDIVRPHTDGVPNANGDATHFRIVKVSN